MNQYRVSLWIENQGDIPDCDFQFQVVGVKPDGGQLVVASLLLSGQDCVRVAEVSSVKGGVWLPTYRRVDVCLSVSGQSLFLEQGED